MNEHAESGPRSARLGLRTLAIDALLVAAVLFLVLVWFSEKLSSLPLALPLAAAVGCAVVWRLCLIPHRSANAAASARTWPRPHWETLCCVMLAVAYRLPAIIHPWAWANHEAAYAGFPALRICAWVRPGPVFAEGAPYMGTLKGHLAAVLAVVTRSGDFSLLLVLTSLMLYGVFIAATMSLARRVAGRMAALATGVYLAVSPPFVTAFSVNCLGQYVDLLALGGLSLALLARLLDERLEGPGARGCHFAIGLALGLAFWQQPLAIVYVAVVAAAYVLRAVRARDVWSWYVVVGLGLGVSPLLIWNWEHAGATREVVTRALTPLSEVPARALRLGGTSFSILMGAGRHLPLANSGAVSAVATLMVPALLLAFAVRCRPALRGALAGRPTPALLPPLLLLVNTMIVLAMIRGSPYERPRYLLPIAAATAVHLGVVVQWISLRWRWTALGVLAAVVAWNAAGTFTRPFDAGNKEGFYRQLIAALDEHGLRSGYADLSIAHPVTLFTSERIVLSPRFGPTRAWESPRHAQRIRAQGVGVVVLRPQDDPEALAQRLRALGVGFNVVRGPTPLFFGFSRPVTFDELSGGSPALSSAEEFLSP
jgi:hypothetical protein